MIVHCEYKGSVTMVTIKPSLVLSVKLPQLYVKLGEKVVLGKSDTQYTIYNIHQYTIYISIQYTSVNNIHQYTIYISKQYTSENNIHQYTIYISQ